jgi:hypothetical protein
MRWLRELWRKSENDEEKDFMLVVWAAERMNLLYTGHAAWGFTEGDVNAAFRRRVPECDPDERRLVLLEGESMEDFEGRCEGQKASYYLCHVDTVVLKAFVAKRETPLFKAQQQNFTQLWAQATKCVLECHVGHATLSKKSGLYRSTV